MSYQVSINQSASGTSMYVNRNEDMLNLDAANNADTVQATGEMGEQIEQIMNSDIEPATTTQVLKNTEQYMELLEKNGATNPGDDELSEEEQRKQMREIYKNLTADEIAKLKMMNIDISSVELSDIMGLVAGIRSAENQAEFNRELATICNGIDSVKGDATHESLRDALASMMPEELDNVKLNHLIDQNFQIDEQQTIYLMKNELELTISNLYKSEFATTAKGATKSANLSEADFEALSPKFQELIEKAGLSGEDETYMFSGIRTMLEHGAPVSVGNLRNYVAIRDINKDGVKTEVLAANMLEQKAFGQDVENANVYYETIGERAEHFVEKMNAVSIEVQVADMSKAEITAKRQLEEIRLSLTHEVATRLVMKNMHIDTSELSEVVRQLKEVENQMASETLEAFYVEPSKENVAIYQETMHKVAGLKEMPAAALVIATREEMFTINSLYEEGISQSAKQAVGHYETMMTAPRSDMGDSIGKAFARMDSLLQEMGIENTEANQRAVRILGYNQMEITEASIKQIKEADLKVQTMLREMTPQAVVQLIRENQNPLHMSVDALNVLLKQNKGDTVVKEDERYSEYLYRLDQKGEISEAEKESYIGIFRLLNKISKFSGRDIGTVVNNGQELTLANLLSAHRSNQAKGMELEASDENGMLSSVTARGTSISEQIATAFRYEEELVQELADSVSPEGIDFVGGMDAFLEMSLEQGKEAMQHTKNANFTKHYSEELFASEAMPEVSVDVEKMLTEFNISYTAGNVQVLQAMQQNRAGVFGLVKNLYKTCRKDDEESLQDMFSVVEENFTDQDSIQEAYEDISNQMSEMVDAAVDEGVISFRDIQSLKQIHAGMSILNKMSNQESYQVPVELEDGWAMMTVQFVSMEQTSIAGSISCTMQHTSYGWLKAEIVTGENATGSLESENNGELELPEFILDMAKTADSKTKQYALAKEMIRVFADL